MSNFEHKKTRNLIYINSAIAMLIAMSACSYKEEMHRGIDDIIDELFRLRDALEDIEEG